jgi:chromosomal replication initiation ATPase DnaA
MDNIQDLVLLKNIVHEVASKIRKQDFLTYFKRLSLIGIDGTTLTLGVVSSFMRDNISYKFSAEILTAVQTLQSEIIKIEYIIDREIDNPANPNVVDCAKEYKEWNNRKKKDETPGVTVVDGISTRTINDKYRLDNFIV